MLYSEGFQHEVFGLLAVEVEGGHEIVFVVENLKAVVEAALLVQIGETDVAVASDGVEYELEAVVAQHIGEGHHSVAEEGSIGAHPPTHINAVNKELLGRLFVLLFLLHCEAEARLHLGHHQSFLLLFSYRLYFIRADRFVEVHGVKLIHPF